MFTFDNTKEINADVHFILADEWEQEQQLYKEIYNEIGRVHLMEPEDNSIKEIIKHEEFSKYTKSI